MKKNDNIIIVKLSRPLDADGKIIHELHLRRPKVRDMLSFDKIQGGNVEKELHLFSNLCEVSPSCLEELDLADYTQLQKRLEGFLS